MPAQKTSSFRWQKAIRSFSGSVANVQPYLSEDGTSLYTEFTVSAEEVLKDSAGLSLNRDSVITLFRIGGSLRLASGRVLRTDVHGLGDPPAANHRYVCFLNYDARGYWFRIVNSGNCRMALPLRRTRLIRLWHKTSRSQFTRIGRSRFPQRRS